MHIRYRRLAILLGLITSFFMPVANADTLQQIYNLATANDPQIRAAEAELKANLENRNLGRSGILPQVSLGGSFSDQTSNYVGSAEETRESTTYSANVRQTLFDFPAWYNYKRGDTLANQAEQDYLSAKQNLILRTATAYFSVLSTLDNMRATKSEEVALAKQLEQTRQRYDVGLIAITDVHEAQAAYDDVVARLVDALGLVGITFENLSVLTGQPHSSIAALNSEFPIVPPVPADPEEWVQMAMENSYTLKSAMLSRDAASFNAQSRKWEHAPSLSLGLSYQDQSVTTNSAIQFLNREGDTSSISLTLDVPLYLGGSVSSSRRQAAYQAIASQEILNNARLTLIQNTRNQHLTVSIDVSQVEARRQAIVSSQSAYEATRAGYDVGTRNLVDVLNAEQAVYQARRDYYRARYEYIIDRLGLDQLVGALGSSDISDIETWLDPAGSIPRNILENSMPGMPLPAGP
jgi:outer membrane protein